MVLGVEAIPYETGPPGIPVLKLKNPPLSENSRKLPLPIKLNYHRHCNTSTLYTACISYVVFMGRDVGYCPSCLYSVLILTVKLFVCVGCIARL